MTEAKDYYVSFMAGSSLCEECQKTREARAIIATPRIQVEEDRDSLRQQLAEAKAENFQLTKEKGAAWGIRFCCNERDCNCQGQPTDPPSWWCDIDELKQQLEGSERMRGHANARLGRLEPEVEQLRDEAHDLKQRLAEREAEILELRKRKPLVGSHDVERFYPGDDNAALNDEEKG